MIPDVGTVCAFTFLTKFATLNGIYKIKAEMTFNDAYTSGTDFLATLYTPAGLSQSDFITDYPSYTKDRIAVLESVTNSAVTLYVPESIFLTIPDPTVEEYFNLDLVVRLGIHKNTQAITPLLDQIKDLIQSQLGTTNPLQMVTNPQNKIYLTSAQYSVLEATRAANVQILMPLSVQLKQEQDKNDVLAAKCAAYEALFTQIATS